jgi:hypothetical protein
MDFPVSPSMARLWQGRGRDVNRHFLPCYQQPAVDTETAWLAEKRKLNTEQGMVAALVGSMILGRGTGICYIAKRQKRPIILLGLQEQ